MDSTCKKKIDVLIKNQNAYANNNCENLFSKNEYEHIFSKDDSITENITELMKEIVDHKYLSTGISCVCGTKEKDNFYNYGYIDDNKSHKVDSDTIVDLASITKLFLSICYFVLYDNRLVNFKKPLSYYTNFFHNISHLSISELMHFRYTITTEKRIQGIEYDEALNLIRNASVTSNDIVYSDIPAIILGILFKKIASVSFGDFVVNEIIDPLCLTNTFWSAKNNNIQNTMNYDNEYNYINGELLKLNHQKFLVHDEKARILSNGGSSLCGHSGLFSCAKDISKFSKAILNGEIISLDSLNLIGTNNKMNPQNHFGFLSYIKDPIARDSEIYWAMSGNSFAMSGFTGNYYMLDPLNKTFCFIGGNKLNERLSKCDDNEFLKSTNLRFTKDFIYKKDALRDELCNLTLLTKFQ